MKDTEFKKWLSEEKAFSKNTINNIISRCHIIETCEGNLDDIYVKDKMPELFEVLQYTKADQKSGLSPKHHIPIDGDYYTSTASYKNAAKNYNDFLNGTRTIKGSSTEPEHSIGVARKKRTIEWPAWEQPSSDSIYKLAIDVVPYIKFLSPKIIEKITELNVVNRDNILESLYCAGIISPEQYLWEGSPCAFPGVRRSVGKNEVKGKALCDEGFVESPDNEHTALYLDDNDIPKQIWSYILRGTYFSKMGPYGYELAHLIDHQKKRNRMFDHQEKINKEMVDVPGEFKPLKEDIQLPLYGLFSSPANSVYIPNALMKPTDHNTDLRKLLFQKAMELYKGVCNIIPEGIELVAPSDSRFDINNSDFKWPEPVGESDYLDEYLDKYFENRRQFYISHGFPDMYK